MMTPAFPALVFDVFRRQAAHNMVKIILAESAQTDGRVLTYFCPLGNFNFLIFNF